MMENTHRTMQAEPRLITILGSTGSIGTQALEVVRANPQLLKVYALSARRNAELLIQQAIEFRPSVVVLAEEEAYAAVQSALQPYGIEVLCGVQAHCHIASHPAAHTVLTAMVGYAGLEPTIAAVQAGKTIALANKETLVVAGGLIMPLAKEHGARIIPVDSEHSAIYQCLVGEEGNAIRRLILTASGGPFRTLSAEALKAVTPAQALKHPNWSMGAKVSVDSASLMNKGLEMIEAHWLFGMPTERIDVLVHPQSIIHSMVEFADGSLKAQLGTPDMRLPISYALGLGQRIPNDYAGYDFLSQGFSFERPDLDRFPNLALAYEAIRRGGNAACALNAANEVAVDAFLSGKLAFVAMPQLVAYALEHYQHSPSYDLDVLQTTDQQVRRLCLEHLSALS